MKVLKGISDNVFKKVDGSLVTDFINPYYDTNLPRVSVKQRSEVTAFNGTAGHSQYATGQFSGAGIPYGIPLCFGNHIYAFPTSSNSGIFKFNLTTKAWSKIGTVSGFPRANIMPDGKIYSEIVGGQFIIFDPQTDTIQTINSNLTTASKPYFYNNKVWRKQGSSIYSGSLNNGNYRLAYTSTSSGENNSELFSNGYVYLQNAGSGSVRNTYRKNLLTGAGSSALISLDGQNGNQCLEYNFFDNILVRNRFFLNAAEDYGINLYDFNTSSGSALTGLISNARGARNFLLGNKRWIGFITHGPNAPGVIARACYFDNDGTILNSYTIDGSSSQTARYAYPVLAKNGLFYCFGSISGGINGFLEIDLKLSSNYMQLYSEVENILI